MLEPWLLFAALIVEACVGYPTALYRPIRHPVVWIGTALDFLERRWNRPEFSDGARRALGIFTVVLVTGSAAGAGYAIQALAANVSFGSASDFSFGGIVMVLAATTGLAQHSLYTHVRAVLAPLASGDLAAARQAVANIVGRDTASLNESDVAGAAIESLAESFNDGIVAPAFWLFVGGLPGLFAYKALNTADSLIGHRDERWRMFGWAAARADDVANLIPARLAGALLAIAGGGGMLVMWRDAPKHASPNAGWPEAAMAGALRIRLGGPTAYDGITHERPIFGAGASPTVGDLQRGLRIYVIACGLLWLLAAAAGFSISHPQAM
ncbi:adenosylcobinamide-phosphate synthase CbiB [Steroidobacter sp.]|uniref:adenosylcobinamide-phosphate synthase CbiB n=1 Tax=Steroidobacter sp. TaxID=1978227 RepID=UPI001A3E45C6|nr:adenosylcobinamide-phosphate synthase CbiB [Steroidobacter sp.]MBL8270445.1 cobalamin biosynthesis protein CobD [Steroidobacter sp.]